MSEAQKPEASKPEQFKPIKFDAEQRALYLPYAKLLREAFRQQCSGKLTIGGKPYKLVDWDELSEEYRDNWIAVAFEARFLVVP